MEANEGGVMSRILVVAAAALVLGGVAGAAPSDTYKLTATLTARAEVPKPTGVRAGATGAFTGQAVEVSGARARLTWRLTFKRLSGRAVAAHIHVGKPRKAGRVMVALCGPCRSGQRGRATITRAQLRTIRAGNAYVNVHTPRNQAGEIRGQVKATRTSSGSGGSPPPPEPPPPTEPPIYP
jgi:hypothetical protein